MRTEIIKKGAEMFLRLGLRSVSIDDICNELHISKRTFYQHFRQKEELIEEMLERTIEKHEKIKIEYDSNLTVIDFINAHFKKFTQRSSMVEKNFVFFHDLEKYYPAIAQKFALRMHDIDQRQVREVLEHGIREGVFRQEIEIEPMVTLLTDGFSNTAKKITDKTVVSKAEFLLDCMMRLVKK